MRDSLGNHGGRGVQACKREFFPLSNCASEQNLKRLRPSENHNEVSCTGAPKTNEKSANET